VYFLATTTLANRGRPLEHHEARVAIESLLWLGAHGRAHVYAFVVMPDHVHTLIQPIAGETVSSAMASWKKFCALRINRLRGVKGPLWQDGFHERAIRDELEFWGARAYIHENPVRSGLVAVTELFPFSSAHAEWAERVEVLR
jgi:REP element-mobilizing transposase RayT